MTAGDAPLPAQNRISNFLIAKIFPGTASEKIVLLDDLPPIVVPLPTRVLEPWTKGEAERSPEAMVLSFQELGGGSPVSCAA